MALLTREHMAREDSIAVSLFAVTLLKFLKSEANQKMVRQAHGEGREKREVLQWPHLETVPHTGLFLLFVILRNFLWKLYKSKFDLYMQKFIWFSELFVDLSWNAWQL